jgi:hypothetical protein
VLRVGAVGKIQQKSNDFFFFFRGRESDKFVQSNSKAVAVPTAQ